jgi:GNAT superfamily N-acetyltransferase
MDEPSDRRIGIRALRPGDLDAVVAIDRAIERRSRRAYIQRRLEAALREPERHAQFAATDAAGLAGYMLARVMRGEFGDRTGGMRVELLGVREDAQGRGIGRQLHEALRQYARRKGLRDLRTAADWRDHRMLRFLDRCGYELAAERIVDAAVGDPADRLPRDDDAAASLPSGQGHEIRYGAAPAADYERLARDTVEIRSMTDRDLDDIVRIDRALTGADRRPYIGAQLAETLADSAIRVSLVARVDGAAAGYLMARTDLGDYGRTEPVAVVDTIGVDPAFGHRGVGHALLSQLAVNLRALRVERIETLVGPRDLALTAFLLEHGFAPAQRLAFTCAVG